MERAERIGLGVAAAGHVLLFAILSLGLVTQAKLPPLKNEPMDVVLVDAIGLRAAAPEATPEPPALSEAPAIAKPEEASAPTEAPPEPAPAPAPAPKPAPPKPAPPKRAPPTPRPTPPKPTPAKPAPPPKPAPSPQPAKSVPAKPTPAKPPPAKPAAAKAAATASADTRDRRRPDRAAEAGGAPSTKPAKPAGGKPGDKPAKAAGSRLGPDFLKGLNPEKSTGKSTKPAAAAVSATAMQGLAGAIKRQVEPCYELGSLQGTPAMSIVTSLRLRFDKDGSVATAPTVTEQTGVNAGNQAYARQIAEVGRRAVLRCAPLKLPAELYDGGWEDIELRFIPGQMG